MNRKTRSALRTFAVIVATSVAACSTADKKPAADSVDAIDTVKPAEPAQSVDTPQVDSTVNRVPSGEIVPPTDELPPGRGENHRRGSTMSPSNPQPMRDPMPEVTGETRKPGGTMAPSRPPVYGRDSASGPKYQIDDKGNITPIKR